MASACGDFWIFHDALDANQHVVGELAAAHDAERIVADERIAQIARWRLMLNGGALGMGIVLMLIASLRERVGADDSAVRVDQPVVTIAESAGASSVEPTIVRATPAVSMLKSPLSPSSALIWRACSMCATCPRFSRARLPLSARRV